MTEISFIYKCNKNENINYGKIKLSYISDEYRGLDREIKEYVWNILAFALSQQNDVLKDLHIGVIGTLVDNSYTWHFTSDHFEMDIFKVYIIERKHIHHYYYNGLDVTENVNKFVREKKNEYVHYDSLYEDDSDDDLAINDMDINMDSSTINSVYDNGNKDYDNLLYVSSSDTNDKMSITKSDTISELEYQYEEFDPILHQINVTPEPIVIEESSEEELQDAKYF